MAQIKLLKIGADGFNTEFDSASDEITLNSFSVQGGGPVLSGSGLDLNNQDVSDVKDLSFNNPATATINQTAGALIVDNIVGNERENSFSVQGAILFPTIADDADQVDNFRLPHLASAPTAAPADGGQGYLVEAEGKLFLYNGSAWDDLSTVDTAKNLELDFLADGAIAARDVVHVSGNDDVAKAQANALATSDAIGLAVDAAADNASVKVRVKGEMSGFSSLVAGSRYYLDPSVAGGITPSLPNGAGNYIVQVGLARNASTLLIDIVPLSRRAS